MHLAEGYNLSLYFPVGLEPIEVLHDLLAHPFWKDVHQECPGELGTELLVVIRLQRTHQLLILDA